VLTLCCVKYVTILTSSIVGTAMILSAIDFFTHGLETINWVSYVCSTCPPLAGSM